MESATTAVSGAQGNTLLGSWHLVRWEISYGDGRAPTLPFGARDDKPLSKWTPPASAGRQLSVNDLLGWKGIRTPALSNDGKWFASRVQPSEGDGELILRAVADGKEL